MTRYRTIAAGDCRDVMPTMPAMSIDAIITDPPYEIGLKDWDKSGVAFDPGMWKEALRLLKPGHYLVAFGSARRAHRMVCAIEDAGFEVKDVLCWLYGSGMPKGGNLKPSYEPIILARRPGPRLPLNAADCKLPSGRWPSNTLLDSSVCTMLDDEAGVRPSAGRYKNPEQRRHRSTEDERKEWLFPSGPPVGNNYAGETGGPSRFFYSPKASRTERANGNHPTMKPVALMRWLVRLVTPPNGGVVLDPFAGSGSTLVAARDEGHGWIGIEVRPEYVAVCSRRLADLFGGEAA